MQGTASDFRLYDSNSLQVLARLLAAELKQPAPGQEWLTPDVVLIPQVAMKRWLQAELAETHGIAANLEFLAPGEFVARALRANLGGDDAFDAQALHWRVYAALHDETLMRRPALRALRDYLADGDALKPWSLAAELAATFEKYQAWRRDWLLRWEAGADADDPQALLWRHVAAGAAHRARRIGDYLARFAQPESPLPQGLPSRLFVFATLNVSPDVLRVIATQARVGALHFYLPSPAKEYWGDLQTLKEQLRADADPFAAATDENPLLRDWGAAGRDFMAVLGGYEVVHPSGEIAAYAPPQGEGLLQRLQADLFHRRAQPVEALRDGLDRADPSLQVHACHTRLREVQVLHDQLRALLEDPRFDPPLQPRDIAVLAPDIDPYLPYVEAVFGARRGHADFIPYTVADASPLASEPIADLFLRLLQLPLSRFGLHEILDLLASPALAENGGPDAVELERLHAWLQAAGARWGLDAAHRLQHGAPPDDICTWKFALDRLLLGYASGGEGDIAGVAPWPDLEGGALDVLDALIRLLRLLARQQKLLGEEAAPTEWRLRLLGLLDALFPRPPRADATQRALERLRAEIDGFATAATQAGFEDDVPADVVRAHFATRLGEADTRAPLMSGGVGFGRMVPLRLLPFRAICVLGMNDGDYPRRDPAAGLNRLTAELGTKHRRPGDRSLREDDRYLFLQLFAAAQDVFYLSYLGADPRDGSVREPSTLLSELIDAAAKHHIDTTAFVRDFIVRHPLQPFSPAAFGDAHEPRRFSYRGEWRPAIGGAGARHALPRWFDAPLPASPPQEDDALPLHALRRFLLDPAGEFLKQRLGLRLPDEAEAADDVEPLLTPSRGLAGFELKQWVFAGLLAGDDARTLYARLRARGLLPTGALGERGMQAVIDEAKPYAEAFATWRGDAQAESRPVEIDIDGWKLRGRIDNIYPKGLARVRIGARNGTTWIRHGMDRLFASAAGWTVPLVEFADDGEGNLGPHGFEPFAAEEARSVLAELLALRERGLREPLPFAPRSGWAFYSAEDADKARAAAARQWHGGDYQWAEGDSAAIRLALRGIDPFEDEDAFRDFVATALRVFDAVCTGSTSAVHAAEIGA